MYNLCHNQQPNNLNNTSQVQRQTLPPYPLFHLYVYYPIYEKYK